MPEKDRAPARRPQAMLISVRKALRPTTPVISSGDWRASPTASVTSRLTTTAGSRRRQVRAGAFGTSGRLAQTAPPTAASPAGRPKTRLTRACTPATPSATPMPLSWWARSRRQEARMVRAGVPARR